MTTRDPEQIAILLIEDELVSAAVAKTLLSQGLSKQCVVTHCQTLQAAKEAVGRATPDVIVLDLHLPDASRLEPLCQLLDLLPDTPIVILSGEADETLAIEAVALGAQDYILKSDLTDEKAIARPIRYAIERVQRQRAEQELRETRQQLSIARMIQRRLFAATDIDSPHIQWAGRCVPTDQVGGDYYDCIPLADGQVAIVTADVSGHGVGPAMLMMETRAIIRTLARTHHEPGPILTIANQMLGDDIRLRSFVTMFLAIYDPSTRRFLFGTAGHPGAVIHADGSHEFLRSEDLPLGVESDHTFQSFESDALKTGSMLMVFTDGMTDCTRDGKNFLGAEAILNCASDNRLRHIDRILQALFDLSDSYLDGHVCHDDRTVVLMRPTNPGS